MKKTKRWTNYIDARRSKKGKDHLMGAHEPTEAEAQIMTLLSDDYNDESDYDRKVRSLESDIEATEQLIEHLEGKKYNVDDETKKLQSLQDELELLLERGEYESPTIDWHNDEHWDSDEDSGYNEWPSV